MLEIPIVIAALLQSFELETPLIFGSPACRHNRAAQRRSSAAATAALSAPMGTFGSASADGSGAILIRWSNPVCNGIPSLYAGSARYYAMGRVGYPPALAKALVQELGLARLRSSAGRRLRSGSLTLLLAPWFEEATGVDADRDMLAEAQRLAAQSGVGNVEWVHLRAEALPAGLGQYRVLSVSPSPSIGWISSGWPARRLECSRTAEHVCMFTPPPTRESIPMPPCRIQSRRARRSSELLESYLGPVTRKTKGFLSPDKANREDEVYRAAGFSGPQRIAVPGEIVERTSDQIVAGIFSLSSSTPHLFGERRDAFEADFGGGCKPPTQLGSSASRCVRSPQTSGEPARVRRPTSI